MNRPSPARPLRILVVFDGGVPLRFALVFPVLAERGHRLHLAAAGPLLPRVVGLADELHARFADVTYGAAPRRTATDGWRAVAWTVRGLADLAHNAHPYYESAPVLRRRMEKKILHRLEKPGKVEPIGRAIAARIGRRVAGSNDLRLSRAVIRMASRLEDAIPPDDGVVQYVRDFAPDVVIATGTVRGASDEVDYVKAARTLGVPTGVCVSSWDNLTNKGLLKGGPDRVFVWNDVQVREAEELHGLSRERVRTTGAHAFDRWFELRPSRTREEFARAVGLDPAGAYVAYLCSSPLTVSGNEVDFVRGWLRALRESGDPRLRDVGVLVRPHPNLVEPWLGADLGDERAVVWPLTGTHHQVDEQARAGFFDTLAHSDAVVGINTTAMIEAAILGKSVLTVLVPEFAQESTLHFRHLLAEHGGFLHAAASLDEHVAQLRGVLDEDAAGAERRRRFVESFVRPHGLDRPAAPILADAIEELAALRPPPPPRAPLLARALLSAEAALNAAYGRRRRAGRPAAAASA